MLFDLKDVLMIGHVSDGEERTGLRRSTLYENRKNSVCSSVEWCAKRVEPELTLTVGASTVQDANLHKK